MFWYAHHERWVLQNARATNRIAPHTSALARSRDDLPGQGLLGRSRLLVHVLPAQWLARCAAGRQNARSGGQGQTKGARRRRSTAGLIGYRGKVPVGWVSVGPRSDYAKLARSPVMKPVDDQPVWSIICFVVPSEYRGQGVARALLAGAVAYAKKAWRETDRSLSSGPTGALERRRDVVRCQVDVRQCRFLGSGPPQAAETGRSPEARVRSGYRSNPKLRFRSGGNEKSDALARLSQSQNGERRAIIDPS